VRSRQFRCVAVFLAVVFLLCAGVLAGDRKAFVDEYSARLDTARQNLPLIVRAAEQTAKRWVEHKKVYINTAFGGDNGNFAMEHMSRAGGLGNISTAAERRRLGQVTPDDVLLVGPRSWEKGAEFWRTKLPAFEEQGWLIIVFASRNGVPENLPYDVLIDNGAPTGGYEEGALNSLVNITQGWMWTCELVSALTRLGQCPAVLQCMILPGAEAHNKSVGHPGWEPTLYPCATPIAQGELARTFLAEVERQVGILKGPESSARIAQAADLAATRIQSGHTVWMSSFTHFLDGEVFDNNLSPFKAFRGISCGKNGETFTKNMTKGDLLFWWGEWTINLPWRSYQDIIHSTGADYIPSYRILQAGEAYEGYPGVDDVSDALMVLDQPWPYEGAVVPIPFAPGKMAPITGIHLGLLYRMLDDAVYARLREGMRTGSLP